MEVGGLLGLRSGDGDPVVGAGVDRMRDDDCGSAAQRQVQHLHLREETVQVIYLVMASYRLEWKVLVGDYQLSLKSPESAIQMLE